MCYFLPNGNMLIFPFEFIFRPHFFVFEGNMHNEVAALLALVLISWCIVWRAVGFWLSRIPLCGRAPSIFAFIMAAKRNIFYFMPGSLLACLLVNPLQPQQCPSRTSAKCWPPPWPPLWQWSRLFWPEHHWGVGGPSDVELYWTQVKYLDVVSMMAIFHHLGRDKSTLPRY